MTYQGRQREDILLARRSSKQNLFEIVRIGRAGRRGEAVWADAEVAVVRGPNVVKGLVRSLPVLEIANVPERGWTILHSRGDASVWEEAVAKTLPSLTLELAVGQGGEILRETANVRATVAEILAAVHGDATMKMPIEAGVACRYQAAAEEILLRPGVWRVRAFEPAYRAAALALVIAADVVEGVDVEFKSPDDLYHVQMMQLLADFYQYDRDPATGTA